MATPDLRLTMFLPPDDTLRVWEQRDQLQPTVRWHEMMHEDHATAFTVAKVAKLDLLRAIRQSLDETIRAGGTFESWKADVLPQLKKAGWWGTVSNADLTGADHPIIVNERRLQTIFNTNVRMSQAAGAWAKIQREKEQFPYLRYLSHHYRKHPRLDHYSWHGLILPVDHPWWQTHFPPNGWGCHCHYEQVSEARMRRKGWHVSQPPDEGPGTLFHAAGRAKPIRVPTGIQPGFGYNPGTAHLRAIAVKANQSIDDAVSAGLIKPAREAVEAIVADPAFAQFRGIPDQAFPVQILDLQQAKAIGASGQIVRLSSDTLAKQEAKRAELSIDDYRLLPGLIGQPDFIQPQGNRRFGLYRNVNGHWWRAVVKSTASGDELYVLSLHAMRDRELNRLRSQGSFFEGWNRLISDWLGAR